jgi:hypothetical protein
MISMLGVLGHYAEEEWGSSRNATRESVRLVIIQAIYSQSTGRLKTVEIYCDFCREDLVFSKVCSDNLLFDKRSFE